MIAGIILFIYGLSMTIVFMFSMIQLQLTWHYLRKAKPKLIPEMPGAWPFITIQLPIFNEKYVIERLLDAVSNLNYPKDCFEIQVLDDSNDETVTIVEHQILEIEKKNIHISHLRRTDRVGFKAGALAYGLRYAKGDFIAIFDADFVPNPDFITAVIPYFNNKNVGMVQTRWSHLNEHFNLLTRLQAFGLNAHFTIEQTGRQNSHSFINFNGTAGIWRKQTVLDAGGWQHDTLTEDLDLSYRAQLKGWKFEYLEHITSPSELPIIIESVKSQQFRWNKGTAETARKNMKQVIASNMKLGQKINALFHLFNSSVFIFILLAALLSIPMLYIKSGHPELQYLFNLGSIFLIGFLAISLFYWHATNVTQPAPFRYFCLHFPIYISFSLGLSLHNAIALIEGFLNIKTDFIRTPKFNVKKRSDHWKEYSDKKLRIPTLTYLEGLLMLYFIFGCWYGVQLGDYGFVPFHLMLSLGYGYVFFESLKRHTSNGS